MSLITALPIRDTVYKNSAWLEELTLTTMGSDTYLGPPLNDPGTVFRLRWSYEPGGPEVLNSDANVTALSAETLNMLLTVAEILALDDGKTLFAALIIEFGGAPPLAYADIELKIRGTT